MKYGTLEDQLYVLGAINNVHWQKDAECGDSSQLLNVDVSPMKVYAL